MPFADRAKNVATLPRRDFINQLIHSLDGAEKDGLITILHSQETAANVAAIIHDETGHEISASTVTAWRRANRATA